jgi:hypothetical protein
VALGGFRGLIVNDLWNAFDGPWGQNRYFETIQLADWITKLGADFCAGMAVAGMETWANNISIKFSDPLQALALGLTPG